MARDMLDESDRDSAERLAWWLFADTPSSQVREAGCLDWWLAFEQPLYPLSDAEADELLGRVWLRLQEYKAAAEYKPSAEDYAEWIGLDLGGVFESSGKLTQMLVDRAIEHGRGRGSHP